MAKRALLIGINKYAIPGADLRGCVNDVTDMAETLQQAYGFARSDLTLLLDEQATKAAMQQQIAALVDGASAGDILYLHYSGHGSSVPDTNGDEPDHRDEILCPHDLDWNDPLIDDWLRATFDRLDPRASLTVVMDCCHSGSNTREPPRPPGAPEPEIIARYLPNPNDVERSVPAGGPRRSDRRRLDVDIQTVDIAETVIAGCRDDQTSADADIAGTFNGALTYYLVRAIQDQPDGTYREIHAATLAGLRNSYEQVPQLVGRAPRFDQKFLSAME